MKKGIVIGLKTIDVRAKTMPVVSAPQRAFKQRIFTEDEWNYLNTLPTRELRQRVEFGNLIIRLLYQPEMLNMTPRQADALSSNLRYQQDAIREIIKSREVQNEN